MWVYLISSSYTVHLRLEVIHSNCTKNVATAVSVHHTSVFVLLTCGMVFRLIVLTFLLLMPSNRQLNRLILVRFYSAMTIERVLAELLCCDCERVFCNYLYLMFLHVFILWAVVSVRYPALLSSSYFERTDVDDYEHQQGGRHSYQRGIIWIVVLCMSKNLTYEESTHVFYHLLTFHLDWLDFWFTFISVSTSVASTSWWGSDWLIAIYNYNS